LKIPDIQRSIAKGRLHESNRFETLFGRYFMKFLYVAVVVLTGLMPYWYGPDNYQFNPVKPYILGISLILALLIILRIFSFVKLRRISGQGLVENKKLIRLISQEFNWPLVQDREGYCTLHIARTMMTWERDLLIIYDGDDILVNFSTYATARNQSLQGYFGEKRAFRRFKKRFSL